MPTQLSHRQVNMLHFNKVNPRNPTMHETINKTLRRFNEQLLEAMSKKKC